MKRITLLMAAVGAIAVLPGTAAAGWHPWSDHRRAEREQWRDVAAIGGVASLIGVATHNPTLAAVGLGGAIYGGVRYEDEVGRGGYYRDGRYDRDRHDDRRWNDRRWRDRRDGYR